MAVVKKKTAKRKTVKSVAKPKGKPSIAKKTSKALTTAKKTTRKMAQKMSKIVTRKKAVSPPKRKTISRHKLLTAEGWRRLMTGGKK